MVWDSRNVQTRQFERHAVEHAARIEIHEEQAEQLRFSYSQTHQDFRVVDVSDGGLGLRGGVFLPRNARLTVYVAADEVVSQNRPSAAGESPAVGARRELRVSGVVRRTIMTDIKPTYLVGLQFADADSPDVEALVAYARPAVGGAPPGKGERKPPASESSDAG